MWLLTVIVMGRKEYLSFPCKSPLERQVRAAAHTAAFATFGGGYRISEIEEQGTDDPIRFK